jgi:hypothetical protein
MLGEETSLLVTESQNSLSRARGRPKRAIASSHRASRQVVLEQSAVLPIRRLEIRWVDGANPARIRPIPV